MQLLSFATIAGLFTELGKKMIPERALKIKWELKNFLGHLVLVRLLLFLVALDAGIIPKSRISHVC